MTEITKKKTPIQVVVSPPVKTAIEDEARRLTRLEKTLVTQGDVVARALKHYTEAFTGASGVPVPEGENSREQIEKKTLQTDITHDSFLEYPEPIRETLRKCARVLLSRYAKALTENANTFIDGLDARERLEAIGNGATAPVPFTDRTGKPGVADLARQTQGGLDRLEAEAHRLREEHSPNRKPHKRTAARSKPGQQDHPQTISGGSGD